MSTATKYLLNKPSLHAVEAEPERLTEQDALKILVSASGGAACPLHEVSPVVNHICGPVAAVPPESPEGVSEPRDWAGLRGHGSLRSSRNVAALILDACGLTNPDAIPCRCDGTSAHPLAVTMRHLSHGQVIRAHWNDERAQVYVERAIRSRDVDQMIYQVEPRLECLKMLADRARAEHGGDLPDVVVEAAVVLAHSLAGPTRWDVRTGYRMWEWEPGWRWSDLADKCDWVMRDDGIHDVVLTRLIEGA